MKRSEDIYSKHLWPQEPSMAKERPTVVGTRTQQWQSESGNPRRNHFESPRRSSKKHRTCNTCTPTPPRTRNQITRRLRFSEMWTCSRNRIMRVLLCTATLSTIWEHWKGNPGTAHRSISQFKWSTPLIQPALILREALPSRCNQRTRKPETKSEHSRWQNP